MVDWTAALLCISGLLLGVGASTMQFFSAAILVGSISGVLCQQVAMLAFEGTPRQSVFAAIFHVIGLCVGFVVASAWPVACWSLASGVLSIGLVLVTASLAQSNLHIQVDPNVLSGIAVVLSGLIGWLAFYTGSHYFRHSLAVWSSALAATMVTWGGWRVAVPRPAPFFTPVVLVALGVGLFFAFLSLQLWVVPVSKRPKNPVDAFESQEPVVKPDKPPKYPTEILYN